jgi:hypothetical protein
VSRVPTLARGRSRGLVLAAVAVALLALLALAAIGATPSAGAAKSKAVCPGETLAVFGKPTRLRFALHGGVSCKVGRRTIAAYFRKATDRRCRAAGNICALKVAGGWSCALAGAASEAPLVAGCFRGRASVKAYRVAPASTVPANATEFVARLQDGTIECGLTGAPLVCEALAQAPAGTAPLAQVAKLGPDGGLTTCTQYLASPVCFEGDFGAPIPSVAPGGLVTLGGFACTVADAAVTCTVASTGNGFQITPSAVTAVTAGVPG